MNRIAGPVRAVALWLLGALLLSAGLARADWGEQLGLKNGALLVASPDQPPGPFARSVVLLVGYGPGGAQGVIINRPTGDDLSRDFGDRLQPDVASAPLYYGGPVGVEHRLLLTDRAASGTGGFEVVEGVFFVHGRWLMAGLESLPPQGARYRVLAGYAGWGRLQLEHEVARGDWFVLPASHHFVLEFAPEQLWEELLRYYQAQMALAPPGSQPYQRPLTGRAPLLTLGVKPSGMAVLAPRYRSAAQTPAAATDG